MTRTNKIKNNILYSASNYRELKNKMFTIRESLLDSLSPQINQLVWLSFGRVRGLVKRFSQVKVFFNLLIKIKKNHGTTFTVKWLKCCYVALQKSLGRDNLKSLRELEPNIPLPRLINGIPTVIPHSDRDQIRKGNRKVIVFWSSLFSIYRVLKTPYELKLGTITAPFTGDNDWFNALLIKEYPNYFSSLQGYQSWRGKCNLAPFRFRFLRASSPSNRVSWHGLLTDTWNIYQNDEMRTNLVEYLRSVRELGFNILWFQKNYNDLLRLASGISESPYLTFRVKEGISSFFGQLALKEEAAGKLRVFALGDSISQSLLSPLHDELLKMIKLIPNDGTFDQEASVKRLQSKSTLSGKAFSFDLSAATDRLPVLLSSKVLGQIFSKRFGQAWLSFMVQRDFAMNSAVAERYGYSNDFIRYEVGQPMGFLSSWPMLAITHHWILQHASFLLGRRGWELNYEILGDDLVITDSALASQYLKLAKYLGVEINLSKSISSPNVPVFEFAKRTCIGNTDCSPISFKQLLSNVSLSSRAMNVVNFMDHDFNLTRTMIGSLLDLKGNSKHFLTKRSRYLSGLLAILGALVSMKRVPHEWLIEAVLPPREDGWDLETNILDVPRQTVINLIIHKDFSKYPFSKQELRHENYQEVIPDFLRERSGLALTAMKVLATSLEKKIADYASLLYFDLDHPLLKEGSDQNLEILKLSIIGVINNLLWDDGKYDVIDSIDNFESYKPFYYNRLSQNDVDYLEDISNKVLFQYNLDPKGVEKVRDEISPLFKTLGKIISGKTSRYWEFIEDGFQFKF
nr:MAG: putative RNA dependent RNA polymerase [Hainan mangrove mitovirus 5]